VSASASKSSASSAAPADAYRRSAFRSRRFDGADECGGEGAIERADGLVDVHPSWDVGRVQLGSERLIIDALKTLLETGRSLPSPEI
jgi:hypothetical protein